MDQEKIIKNILAIPSESQEVEFKRLGVSKHEVVRIIESIVAMANTNGGSIILGVDDPEKSKFKGLDRIFGIEENLEIFDMIGKEIQRIIPPLSNIWPPEIIKVKEKNVRIGWLEVPKVVDHFRYINNHVYIRQQKGNKRMTPQEVIDFAYAKGFCKADIELVDVDFELLETRFFDNWKEERSVLGKNIRETLLKTGLAMRNKKNKLLPTRAAVLLFAEYPNDLMDTKCAVRILQYTGTVETIGDTPNLISTPKTIVGPMIKQIKRAHEYVLALLRAGIRVPSGFVTQYQIPERAIKEAVTNAVIHRDYYMKRDIEIKIFEDRVEIQSPGLFPYNITAANIGFTRASGYRNDLLVKNLRDFPSPPNLDQNEGVRAMRGEMKSHNLYPPIFWTYPHMQDSVRVILLNEKIATEWDKVQSFLKENKYIRNEEARHITGIKQRDEMTRLLKKWVVKGLLYQIKPSGGYLKGTRYRLPEVQEISR